MINEIRIVEILNELVQTKIEVALYRHGVGLSTLEKIEELDDKVERLKKQLQRELRA